MTALAFDFLALAGFSEFPAAGFFAIGSLEARSVLVDSMLARSASMDNCRGQSPERATAGFIFHGLHTKPKDRKGTARPQSSRVWPDDGFNLQR